ncbi:uncharacterized protein [Miscanthus floridulus]|uniref:uncharacterized protein n=1 Tax=Miscanthus floridulus TaxID=154761 RepID=UPI003459B451
MKRQADKNRSERSFQVGDKVFVKIQPYVSNISGSSCQPEVIVQILWTLPPSSSVHPVFHVSQLKAAILPGTPVLPSFPTDIELPRVPVEILKQRIVPTATGSVEQVLIRWSGWDREMAAWENAAHLRQAYPRATAWGQAGSQAPGNVIIQPTTSEAAEDDHGPRAGSRTRRPNVRLAGSEWV